jgi:CheY-like chemotaxis protein
VAVVGVTGNALDVDQEAFREAGAVGVVTKPVSRDALVRMLRGRLK